MKFIELEESVKALNSDQINSLLQSIELQHGKTFSLPKIKKISHLHTLSKRKSTTSSNAIEGIKVSTERENEIFNGKFEPETYEDCMLVGYNKALDLIFTNYKYLNFDIDLIFKLHKLIYSDYNPDIGGAYKHAQNYIREEDNSGYVRTVFTPPSPSETPNYLENLVYQFNLLSIRYDVNKLLLISVFILDFLCIHPFDDGNGRVSRLLTTFLLLKFGYDVETYYSLSYIMFNSIDEYYNALEKSSFGWREGKNNYSFFTTYFLKTVLNGYIKLDYIVGVNTLDVNADEKIQKVIIDSMLPISKSDISEILYSISMNTIEKNLKKLIKEKKIIIVQRGRYSLYSKTIS